VRHEIPDLLATRKTPDRFREAGSAPLKDSGRFREA
jgi:hypothetical protein